MTLLLEHSRLSKSKVFIHILVQEDNYSEPMLSYDRVIRARKNMELKVYLG